MAVGSYNAHVAVSATLTERWNGRALAVLPSPNPRGASSSVLNAISCASVSRCVAVGFYTNAKQVALTLAESWNGSDWSITPIPSPKGTTFASLQGISCASATKCMAVGSYITSKLSYYVNLAESWNGRSWSIVRVRNPKGFTGDGLRGVSCVRATQCTAVGSYSNRSGLELTLAESWNGSAWSIVRTPNPSRAQGSLFDEVSCATTKRCMAVGTYRNISFTDVTLAESWNGSRWSVVRSPNPAGAGLTILNSVSCASATRCLAAGHSYTTAQVTLAESWNGSRWSIAASPSPSANSALYGVSCPKAASCLAMGSFFNSSNSYATLAEAWNGRAWSVVNQDADLPAVSCVNASDCLAVGSYLGRSVSLTLAEFWNGVRWAIVATPNPAGTKGSYLNAITCLSTGRCLAVGYYFNRSLVQRTLVESWNGSRWSIVPSPNPSRPGDSAFDAISCATTSVCMAVGSAGGLTLAEAWNGSSWSVVATPSPVTTAYSELDGVSCLGVSDCQAVGYNHDTVVGADITLAESWNGSTWSIIPSPAPGSNVGLASVLSAISCVNTSQCLAVGSNQTTQSGNQVTLSERWTGSAWVLQPSPSPKGSIYSELDGVSCQSTGPCMAVGSYYTKFGNHVTLTETWKGTKWSIVASPNPSVPPPGITYLQAVSCTTAAHCLASGAYGNPANLYPLTEFWNGSIWRLLLTPRP